MRTPNSPSCEPPTGAAGGDDAAIVTSTAPEIEVVLERNRGEALGIALGDGPADSLVITELEEGSPAGRTRQLRLEVRALA